MKRLFSFALLGVVAFGAVSCSKKKAEEPTTTYKYDPLSKSETSVAETKSNGEAKSDRKPSSIPPQTKSYVVQIGAFTKKENAERLLTQLQTKNYPAIMKLLDHKDFGQMYLVRLRPFENRAEADRYATELEDAEKLKPSIFVPKR